MTPLLCWEETDVLYSGDESDDKTMYTDMLEDICDSIQSHPGVNRKNACYKIRDCIKQIQLEWRGALKSTQNMDKGSHKVFKNFAKGILQDLPPLGESSSEVSFFIPEPRNFYEVIKLSDDNEKPWIKANQKEI